MTIEDPALPMTPDERSVCRAFGVPPWVVGVEPRRSWWGRLRWRFLHR